MAPLSTPRLWSITIAGPLITSSSLTLSAEHLLDRQPEETQELQLESMGNKMLGRFNPRHSSPTIKLTRINCKLIMPSQRRELIRTVDSYTMRPKWSAVEARSRERILSCRRMLTISSQISSMHSRIGLLTEVLKRETNRSLIWLRTRCFNNKNSVRNLFFSFQKRSLEAAMLLLLPTSFLHF